MSSTGKATLGQPVLLTGCYNFRDLGSYKTYDGRRIASGRIYRSDAMGNVSDLSILLLKLGINTVVDLRSLTEVERAPVQLCESIDYVHCDVSYDETFTGNNLRCLLQNREFENAIYGDNSAKHAAARYRDIFRRLLKLQDNEAILFFCSLGRDRTGMAAALILHVLGVSREGIIDDYMQSEKMLQPIMSGITEAVANVAGLPDNVVTEAMRIKPENIYLFFRSLTRLYGGVDRSLHKSADWSQHCRYSKAPAGLYHIH